MGGAMGEGKSWLGAAAGGALGLVATVLVACGPSSAPAPAGAGGGSPTPASGPARVTVRWAAISPNPNNWPVYVAQSQGFFDEMAIDLDLTYTDASTRAVQVLASRDADITSVAADTAIEAIERGAPFVMVGGSTRLPVYTLIARPEIRSYADLRGKLVGVTGANVAEGPLLRKLLARYGLRDEDYETIAVGGPCSGTRPCRAGR